MSEILLPIEEWDKLTSELKALQAERDRLREALQKALEDFGEIICSPGLPHYIYTNASDSIERIRNELGIKSYYEK